MKNRIPVTVLPTKELLVAYYIKGLPMSISMWVKCARKLNMQGAFREAILVEKDMFGLKYNTDLEWINLLHPGEGKITFPNA